MKCKYHKTCDSYLKDGFTYNHNDEAESRCGIYKQRKSNQFNEFDELKKSRPCKKCGKTRVIVADGLCSDCYYKQLYEPLK